MRRPRGWSPTGPVPPGPSLPGLPLSPNETLDCLSGHWKIYQLRRGHRYSTDDLLTAWFAVEVAREGGRTPQNYLDLGCGIGSIGLMVLWRLPEVRMIGVEAQAESVGLARRSLEHNGASGRAQIRHGDLRDPRVLMTGELFDLVTGSPPYLVPSEGRRSASPQRASCRFEDRGGIRSYLEVAARHLAPGGDVVWCHATRYTDANRTAARNAGLSGFVRREVLFREGRESLISLFRAQKGGKWQWRESAADEPALVIRDRDSRWGAEYREIRRRMGFPAL